MQTLQVNYSRILTIKNAKFPGYCFCIRVRSYERWNELKPVWDFISVENLTSVFSQLFTCVHMNWGEMKLNGMDFISVILTKMKLQTSMRFSCEHNLPEKKWISAESLDIAFDAHVRLKLNVFHIGHFDKNKISFRVIKYHVNTTRNEMLTHVHQNTGSFWNAAEMKLHVDRTCFHAGLKSQTGMSSFCVSCERSFDTIVSRKREVA